MEFLAGPPIEMNLYCFDYYAMPSVMLLKVREDISATPMNQHSRSIQLRLN